MSNKPSYHTYTVKLKHNIKRLTIYSLFTLLVFALSFLFVTTPNSFVSGVALSPLIIQICGLLGIVSTVLWFYWLFKAVIRSKYAIQFDDYKLWLNLPPYQIFECKWTDVEFIGTAKLRRIRYLTIHLKNSEMYRSLTKSALERYMARTNLRMIETPLYISALPLNISFEDLSDQLHAKHERVKTNQMGLDQ